jgi:hypothetical protein
MLALVFLLLASASPRLLTPDVKQFERVELELASRIVKIFALVFLPEVTPPPIAALHLVFRPPVTDTHRQYGR